jgi:hypothetical protein
MTSSDNLGISDEISCRRYSAAPLGHTAWVLPRVVPPVDSLFFTGNPPAGGEWSWLPRRRPPQPGLTCRDERL